MKILDSENNLIAIVSKFEDFKNGKQFVTSKESQFQIGLFNLKKDLEIQKHIHPENLREVYKTCETIVLIEGSLKINLYDDTKKFLNTITLLKGDSITLFSGGHGILLKEDSKFIEIKQGPYSAEIDKIRF